MIGYFADFRDALKIISQTPKTLVQDTGLLAILSLLFAFGIAIEKSLVATAEPSEYIALAFLFTIWILCAVYVTTRIINRFTFLLRGRKIFFHLEKSQRDLVSQLPAVRGRAAATAQDNLFKTASSHLEQIVEYAADVVSAYTKSRCAITIKLLYYPAEASNEIPYVRTLVRDKQSRAARAEFVTRDGFPYTENTAFESILKNPKVPFISDDLIRLNELGKYQNSNPDWKRYYNKCVVLPIGRYVTENRFSIVGFLCLDSLTGPITNGVVLERLVNISDYAYNTFGFIFALLEKEGHIVPESIGLLLDPTHAGGIRRGRVEALETVLRGFDDYSAPTDGIDGAEYTRVVEGRPAQPGAAVTSPKMWERNRMRRQTAQAASVESLVNEIVTAAPSAIAMMEEAFRLRADIPGLPEAKGIGPGLVEELSGLLRESPPKRYVEEYRALSSGRDDDEKPSAIAGRVHLIEAIKTLEQRDPAAMRRLRKNASLKGISDSECIGALLLQYHDRREFYPF